MHKWIVNNNNNMSIANIVLNSINPKNLIKI